MIRRIYWLIKARNREFYRDLSALGWNFLFPLLVVVGFGFIFSGRAANLYKVGVVRGESRAASVFDPFLAMKHVQFVDFKEPQEAEDRLRHHRIDLLLDTATKPPRYWISDSSPKGYLAEKLLLGSLEPGSAQGGKVQGLKRESVKGQEIPYAEWVFPGVLGMNLMFSALWGVGYVVVRYRKNGVLKRLRATPVTAWEFLTAQVTSRMTLLMGTTAIVYAGCWLLYRFDCRGSLLTLALAFFLGTMSMVSMGLVVAARSASEEFAGGILNLISWPMMFMSEVWFSLEGSTLWVRRFAELFPLTHLVKAARAIMNDGATAGDVQYHLCVLAVMSVVFLGLGSVMFQWEKR